MFKNSKAILISVDKYDDGNIYPLEYTKNDIEGLEKQLLNNGFVKENIKKLPEGDKGATRAAIYNLINKLALQLIDENDNPAELVVIYFSGHSWLECDYFDIRHFDKKTNTPTKYIHYLLPMDSEIGNLNGTAINAIDFREMVCNLHASRIVLVLDACYSGVEDLKSKSVGTIDASLTGQNPFSDIEKRNIAILTSSKGDQKSEESETYKHGLFTHFFIEGIKSLPGDDEGIINHKDLFKYILKQVKSESKLMQTPILISKVNEAIPLAFNKTKRFKYLMQDIGCKDYYTKRGIILLQKKDKDENLDSFEKKILGLVMQFMVQEINKSSFIGEVDKTDIDCISALMQQPGNNQFQQQLKQALATLVNLNTNPRLVLNKEMVFNIRQLLCQEIDFTVFIDNFQKLNNEFIRNYDLHFLPFTKEFSKKVLGKISTNTGLKDIEAALRKSIVDLSIGEITIKEFKRRIIDSLDSKLTSITDREEWYKLAKTAIDWYEYDLNDKAIIIIESFIWKKIIDNEKIEANRFTQTKFDEFDRLITNYRTKFNEAVFSIKNGDLKTALESLGQLHNCPPPRILFNNFNDTACFESINKDLAGFLSQGNNEEAISTINEILAIKTKTDELLRAKSQMFLNNEIQNIVDEAYAYPLFIEDRINYYSSMTEIKAFFLKNTDNDKKEALQKLRIIDKRLFIDYFTLEVNNKAWYDKISDVISENPEIPGSIGQILEIDNKSLLGDVCIYFNVINKREEFVNDSIGKFEQYAKKKFFGGLARLIALTSLGLSMDENDIGKKDDYLTKAMIFIVINLADDKWWEGFIKERETTYKVSIGDKNAIRTRLIDFFNEWLMKMADEATAGKNKKLQTILSGIRIKYLAELRGAELLKKIQNVPNNTKSASSFVCGYNGAKMLNQLDKISTIIHNELNSDSTGVKLDLQESKDIDFLFTKFNEIIVLMDEDPQKALDLINKSKLKQDGKSTHLLISIELKLAERKLNIKDLTSKSITNAIKNIKNAIDYAIIIKSRTYIRNQIIAIVKNKLDNFDEIGYNFEKSGNYRSALNIYDLSLNLINSIVDQVFADPVEKRLVQKSLEKSKAGFLKRIGLILSNHYDKHSEAAKFFRSAVNILPFNKKMRINFLMALINAGQFNIIHGRFEESKFYFNEALNVAKEGQRKFPYEKEFEEFQDSAKKGLKGEIPFFI